MSKDLNRKHSVTLTEGQISTILYILEGYIQGNDDYDEDSVFYQDVNTIFEELEGVVDDYYNVSKCIVDTNGDYAECVDHLVEKMEAN